MLQQDLKTVWLSLILISTLSLISSTAQASDVCKLRCEDWRPVFDAKTMTCREEALEAVPLEEMILIIAGGVGGAAEQVYLAILNASKDAFANMDTTKKPQCNFAAQAVPNMAKQYGKDRNLSERFCKTLTIDFQARLPAGPMFSQHEANQLTFCRSVHGYSQGFDYERFYDLVKF